VVFCVFFSLSRRFVAKNTFLFKSPLLAPVCGVGSDNFKVHIFLVTGKQFFEK